MKNIFNFNFFCSELIFPSWPKPIFSKDSVLITEFHSFLIVSVPFALVKEDTSQSTFYTLVVFLIGIWHTGINLNQQIRQDNISRIINNRYSQKHVSGGVKQIHEGNKNDIDINNCFLQ